MVRITRATLEPETWFASAVDGYRPSGDDLRVRNEVDLELRRRQAPLDDPDRYFAALFATAQYIFSRQHYHPALIDDSPCAHCDLFVLRPQTEQLPEPDSPEEVIHGEVIADPRRSDYLQVIVVEPGCQYIEECTQQAWERLGFQPKEDCQYRDAAQFRSALHDVCEEILRPYTFPQNLVEEILQKRGYACPDCFYY